MAISNQELQNRLKKAGIEVDSIWDLVNTKNPYPEAIPVLVNVLEEGVEDINTKEGVIRALTVREIKNYKDRVSSMLIKEYNCLPKDKLGIKWAIGNIMEITITQNHEDEIIKIVKDKKNGISRQMFVLALGKLKSKKVEDTLIELISDDEVLPHVINALGKLKSKRAKSKIKLLINHPRALVRKEVQKALKKIDY